MIAAYNRARILKSLFLFIGSLFCYAAMWLFFRYGIGFVFDAFKLSPQPVSWLSLAMMGGVTYGGWRQWQRRESFQAYSESSLYYTTGCETGGNAMIDYYTHQVTGPAYILSQIFLGGPLLTLRAIQQIRLRLPSNEALEKRVVETLAVLRAANKWQDISEYPDREEEIRMLAQMKRIDSSRHKGSLRFKAHSPHGV